jgi:hypothetical protein
LRSAQEKMFIRPHFNEKKTVGTHICHPNYGWKLKIRRLWSRLAQEKRETLFQKQPEKPEFKPQYSKKKKKKKKSKCIMLILFNFKCNMCIVYSDIYLFSYCSAGH